MPVRLRQRDLAALPEVLPAEGDSLFHNYSPAMRTKRAYRRSNRNRLPLKYQRILHRSCLVIRIPNGMVPALCDLMECKHDHPRRIAMQFIRDGIKRAQRQRAISAQRQEKP